MFLGAAKLNIKSIFALSTSIPSEETMCPKTIPFVTMKSHFSQFKISHFSSHLDKTNFKLAKQSVNEDPKTTTVNPWYDGHSTSINTCEVWGIGVRVQISKKEIHTYTLRLG